MKGRYLILLALVLLALVILTGCVSNKSNAEFDINKFIQENYKNCVFGIEFCNNLVAVDCGVATDGSLYYLNKQTGERISTCGGACWIPQGDQVEVCRTLCPPKEWNCNEPPPGIGLSDRIAVFDTATIEATVISLTLSEGENPYDKGIIRIDEISNYESNPKAKYEPLSREIIGNEISTQFFFSARPAIKRCEALPVAIPESDTTTHLNEKSVALVPESENYGGPGDPREVEPIPKEGEYFIYKYYTGTCPEDIILPGLNEGDKITFPITYTGSFPVIGEYEIIS